MLCPTAKRQTHTCNGVDNTMTAIPTCCVVQQNAFAALVKACFGCFKIISVCNILHSRNVAAMQINQACVQLMSGQNMPGPASSSASRVPFGLVIWAHSRYRPWRHQKECSSRLSSMSSGWQACSSMLAPLRWVCDCEVLIAQLHRVKSRIGSTI